MNDLKPNDPKLAIQPSLFPVDTILKTHRTWQSKLKIISRFSTVKQLIRVRIVFDHLNNAISPKKSVKSINLADYKSKPMNFN
jgi:hypothetical protein